MRYASAGCILIAIVFSASSGFSQDHHSHGDHGGAERQGGRAPEEMPKVPSPDVRAAFAPAGYRVEIVGSELTYPTSVEFDDAGQMYLAEAGFNYGDEIAPARILVRTKDGRWKTAVADRLNGPITDLLWHDGRLYIAHRGKVSVLDGNEVRDLVTGLPSLGDHHNNQLAAGPDAKIYFGQGTATNSGVVGLDNFMGAWLGKYPEVHDIPAKDIRLTNESFETPDPLALFADRRQSHEGKSQSSGQGHEGHGKEKTPAKDQEQAPSKGHEGHAQATAPAKAKGTARANGTEHERHVQANEPPKTDVSTKDVAPGKGQEHEGHQHAKKPSKSGTTATETARGNNKEHEEHDHAKAPSNADKPVKESGSANSKGHEGHGQGHSPAKTKANGHTATRTDGQNEKAHAGHGKNPIAKGENAGQGHEGHGAAKSSESGAAPKQQQQMKQHQMVKSFAFQPFGKTPPDDGAVLGTVKASGTILRMNPDGSDLEMYAWGLRNPFGLAWGPDGKLFASDNGYDDRGSRPIAHAPDCVWLIKQDAWYGFPDFAGGVPVTDTRFAPANGPAPKFLMRDHPNVEEPLATLTHHVGAAKMDVSRRDEFGFAGQLFLALAGDMNPITGVHEERSGYEVVRIDPSTGEAERFFGAKSEVLGPKGMEYVVTAGPRRPVDVLFSPDGNSLYVVDVGAMAIVSTAAGYTPRPFPHTGIVWRITRDAEARQAKSLSNPERSRK